MDQSNHKLLATASENNYMIIFGKRKIYISGFNSYKFSVDPRWCNLSIRKINFIQVDVIGHLTLIDNRVCTDSH